MSGRAGGLRAKTDRVVGFVLAALFAALILDVLWQVIARFSPVPVPASLTAFTEELARSLLLWLAMLGGAYAAGSRSHLAIDLISRHLRGRVARWHGLVTRGLTMLFAVVVLVAGGTGLVRVTLELGQVSASLRVPMGAIYLALPIGGLLMAWHVVLDATAPANGGEATPEDRAWTG